MHQPLGNLLALHNSEERWETRQILWCYDRTVRMLEDPAIRETFHDVINIEDMLNSYRQSNIEFVGSGLYHTVYPLKKFAD